MLEKLRVHGFRTLTDTGIDFSPLTIMVGKNGVGKTTILDALQIVGNFAQAGVQRAFGPPPWSLAWQRSKNVGTLSSMDFELHVKTDEDKRYRYELRLNESLGKANVKEERLTRTAGNTTVASYEWDSPPDAGTILAPNDQAPNAEEIRKVADIFRSFRSYELDPSSIERKNDPDHTYIDRTGFGIPAYLAKLKDAQPERFGGLLARFQGFRPETEEIEIRSSGRDLFWSLRDKQQQHGFPAPRVSWGDRQLLGLLCVLFSAQAGSTIAIEEIDRGFHPSRFGEVIDLLSLAAYDGIDGTAPFQIVVTTHSPSFINKLSDRLDEIRMVERAPGGGTVVHCLSELVKKKLGADRPEQAIGEIIELGVLEEVIQDSMS